MAAFGSGTYFSGSVGGAAAAEPNGTPERQLFMVGATKNYGNGLKVTFLGVKKDSRCPEGLKCDTPGDAAVILRVKVGKQEPKTYTIHTNRRPQKLVIPGQAGLIGVPKSYVIKIVSLSPERFSFVVKIPQDDYRLDLQANAIF